LADTDKSYTVGELGRLFGLSRTALLYYDAIGLLKPSGRSASGYRRYGEADRGRLERIVAFRALGMPLASIPELLDVPPEGAAGALLARLFEINGRIEELRAQQRGILGLLEDSEALGDGRARRRGLKIVGARIGVDESNYKRVHASFERASPEEHRRLLRALGFTEEEAEDFVRALADRP
jgi:MerR family transcriptional regulator, thiopeptide resistance regulator